MEFSADLAEALSELLPALEVRVLEDDEIAVALPGDFGGLAPPDAGPLELVIGPGEISHDGEKFGVAKPEDPIGAAAVLLCGEPELLGSVNGAPVYYLGSSHAAAALFSTRGVFAMGEWISPRYVPGDRCFGRVAAAVVGDAAPSTLNAGAEKVAAWKLGDSGIHLCAPLHETAAGVVSWGAVVGPKMPRLAFLSILPAADFEPLTGETLELNDRSLEVSVTVGESNLAAFSVSAGDMSAIGVWAPEYLGVGILSPPGEGGLARCPAVPLWDELVEALAASQPTIVASWDEGAATLNLNGETHRLKPAGGRGAAVIDWTRRGSLVRSGRASTGEWFSVGGRPTAPVTPEYAAASSECCVAWLARFGDGGVAELWSEMRDKTLVVIGPSLPDAIEVAQRRAYGEEAATLIAAGAALNASVA